jgi:hypothetical protein
VLNLRAKAAMMPTEPGLDSMAWAGRRQAGSPYAPYIPELTTSGVLAALKLKAVVLTGRLGVRELDGGELAFRQVSARVHAA